MKAMQALLQIYPSEPRALQAHFPPDKPCRLCGEMLKVQNLQKINAKHSEKTLFYNVCLHFTMQKENEQLFFFNVSEPPESKRIQKILCFLDVFALQHAKTL